MCIDPPISLDAEEITNVVRKTFDRTWNDFYAWKPAANLVLDDDHLVNDVTRLDESLVFEMENHWAELELVRLDNLEFGLDQAQSQSMDIGVDAGRSPLTASPVKLHRDGEIDDEMNGVENEGPSYGFEWRRNQSKRSVPAPPPIEGIFHLPNPLEEDVRVPPYYFCVSRIKSGWSPDEKLMPFIPSFPDEIAHKFNEDKYKELFDQIAAWTQPGREPDTDIIQVETFNRLQIYNLSTADIDATRVLPSECRVIQNLDLTRDLPPFPRPDNKAICNGNSGSSSKKRKWSQPLMMVEEVIDHRNDDVDTSEIHCFRPGCMNFACRKHNGLVDGTLVSLAHSHPTTTSTKPEILRSSIFPLDTTPCSDECYIGNGNAYSNIANSDIPNHQQAEIDLEHLTDCITNWKDIGFVKCCDLTSLFTNQSCRRLAQYIESIADFVPDEIAHAVDSSGGEEQGMQVAKQQVTSGQPKISLKFRLNPPSISTNFRIMCDFEECHHEGPCTEGTCICYSSKWPCGRNCGCPPECRRRFRGCDCRRIRRGAVSTPGGSFKRSHTSTKVCTPEKCPCQKAQRECDPELCFGCGARDSLHQSWRRSREQDGASKFAAITTGLDKMSVDTNAPTPSTVNSSHIEMEDKQWHNCSNIQLQSAQWPKLRVGISAVAGYGLFADESIKAGRMIGEYVGEIVSPKEGEKRTLVNDLVGRQYIFAFNADYEIDSANYGNVTRFINSGKGNEINCDAGMRIVRDDLCIVFFASRNIKRHEEIRFNYGHGFAFEDSAEKAQSKNKQAQAMAQLEKEKGSGPHSVNSTSSGGGGGSGGGSKKSRLSRSHTRLKML